MTPLHTISRLDDPPVADTWLGFDADGLTATDPDTDTILVQIPIETYQAAQAARGAASAPVDAGEEFGEGFSLLASRDGERFLVRPSTVGTPDADEALSVLAAATNGDLLLVRFGDEWIRYDLP